MPKRVSPQNLVLWSLSLKKMDDLQSILCIKLTIVPDASTPIFETPPDPDLWIKVVSCPGNIQEVQSD